MESNLWYLDSDKVDNAIYYLIDKNEEIKGVSHVVEGKNYKMTFEAQDGSYLFTLYLTPEGLESEDATKSQLFQLAVLFEPCYIENSCTLGFTDPSLKIGIDLSIKLPDISVPFNPMLFQGTASLTYPTKNVMLNLGKIEEDGAD